MSVSEQAHHESIRLDNYASPATCSIGELVVDGFVSKSGVANFLGLKYADITQRFGPSVETPLLSRQGRLDATKYGPRCPQKVDGVHVIMSRMFEMLSSDQWCDEADCLHLNIYAPAEAVGSVTKLPVFVWIHGGGFNNGDNTTEFDGNHLVKRSMDLGKPVVVVTINYRLNVFGFLTSKELCEEAELAGTTPVWNQGLQDQRLALRWIRSHIPYFGGDPSLVTLGGESAGAASTYCQLKGSKPLFQQAYIQSSPGIQLRTLEQSQQEFDSIVQKAGIPADAPAADKLARLRELSWKDLLACFSDTISTPIDDPNWFVDAPDGVKQASYWADLPSWCKQAVLGYNKDEASLFLIPLMGLTVPEIKAFVHETTGADIALPAGASETPSELVRLISDVASRVAFVQPCIEHAAAGVAIGKKVFLHELACPDPYPGPLQSFTWHSMGNSILFYQPPCRDHPTISSTADLQSAAVTDFFYGKEPWQALGAKNNKMVWNGAESGLSPVTLDEDRKPQLPSIIGLKLIDSSIRMQTR